MSAILGQVAHSVRFWVFQLGVKPIMTVLWLWRGSCGLGLEGLGFRVCGLDVGCQGNVALTAEDLRGSGQVLPLKTPPPIPEKLNAV